MLVGNPSAPIVFRLPKRGAPGRAGDQNRTGVNTVEACGSTIELRPQNPRCPREGNWREVDVGVEPT